LGNSSNGSYGVYGSSSYLGVMEMQVVMEYMDTVAVGMEFMVKVVIWVLMVLVILMEYLVIAAQDRLLLVTVLQVLEFEDRAQVTMVAILVRVAAMDYGLQQVPVLMLVYLMGVFTHLGLIIQVIKI